MGLREFRELVRLLGIILVEVRMFRLVRILMGISRLRLVLL